MHDRCVNHAPSQCPSYLSVSTIVFNSSRFRFANLQEKGIDNSGEPSPMTWLLHRYAFPIACTKVAFSEENELVPPAAADPPELAMMVDIYHDLTSFKWVKEWSELVRVSIIISRV